MSIPDIPFVIVGLALLVLGRKLFWLMVAVAGFAVGWFLTPQLFPGSSEQIPIITGVALGLLGALLALFAQKVAIWLGGFLAGGYILMSLIRGFSDSVAFPVWIPFVVGGILGAILLKQVFEWGLIVLTSILGAVLVVFGFDGSENVHLLPVMILSIIGIVIQARLKGKKKP